MSQTLRSGYTTGACATATSLAAGHLLLSSKTLTECSIRLPKGQEVLFEIHGHRSDITEGWSSCSTIKDAGDDPDVTHGAKISSKITLSEQSGVRFLAGSGVGTVTRSGLSIAVGEPAINPVPRSMISEHLSLLAQATDYRGGFDVEISIENGQALALKTMNPRLGIVGGLSVLGTTGIVRPFSCAAFIASIHQGIEVAHDNGHQHLIASTGSTSETTAAQHFGLPDMALIEMGDFVGAVLKHTRKVEVKRLTIAGGFGKLSKLAQGHRDLHSRASSIDFAYLAELAKEAGADNHLLKKITACNTSLEALQHCQNAHIDLASKICQQAQHHAKNIAQSATQIDILAVDKQGHIVGISPTEGSSG